MERGGSPPRIGLREQRTVAIRRLSPPRVDQDVRVDGCPEPQGAGGPQRGEMGDLHQEGTDRGPRPGRSLAEPYHPGSRTLPITLVG